MQLLQFTSYTPGKLKQALSQLLSICLNIGNARGRVFIQEKTSELDSMNLCTKLAYILRINTGQQLFDFSHRFKLHPFV